MQTSLQLGSKLLKGLGVMSDDVSFLSQLVRDSMELQAQAGNKTAGPEPDVMKSLQVYFCLCADHKYLLMTFIYMQVCASMPMQCTTVHMASP